MTEQELAAEIRDIIGPRYRVNLHIAASGPAGLRRYAIWQGDKAAGTLRQLIEPCTHREAQECRESLIISDIIDLVEKARKS